MANEEMILGLHRHQGMVASSRTSGYLWGGGVAALAAIGFIVGAIRPHKHAQAAPGSVPEVQVVQVKQQDV